MASTLEKLVVGLGFKYDDKDAKKFGKDLESLRKGANRLAAAVTGVAVATIGVAVASSKVTNAQSTLARSIGITIEKLTALEQVTGTYGGVVSSVGSSLKGLSKSASEAFRGEGRGVKYFEILGLNAADAEGAIKDIDVILREVIGAFEKISRIEQIELAKKLGIAGLLPVLQLGLEAFDDAIERAEALGVSTSEDAVIADDFQEALGELWAVLKDIGRTISLVVLPPMTELLNTFLDWWIATKDIIDLKLPEFLRIAGKFAKLFVVPWIVFKALDIAVGIAKITKSILKLNVAMAAGRGLVKGFLALAGVLGISAVAGAGKGKGKGKSGGGKTGGGKSTIPTKVAKGGVLGIVASGLFGAGSDFIEFIKGNPSDENLFADIKKILKTVLIPISFHDEFDAALLERQISESISTGQAFALPASNNVSTEVNISNVNINVEGTSATPEEQGRDLAMQLGNAIIDLSSGVDL